MTRILLYESYEIILWVKSNSIYKTLFRVVPDFLTFEFLLVDIVKKIMLIIDVSPRRISIDAIGASRYLRI